MMIDRYGIGSSGYGAAYEYPLKDGDYVMYEDMHDYVIKLKLDFESRMANAVNEAYDEGWKEGYKDGISL